MSQKVKLGNYISIKGGGTPNKAIEAYWNGEIPWMSVKDLKGTIVKSTINTITPIGLANSAANFIKKDSLIIATRMAVGKVVYAGLDTAINQDLKAITVSPGLYHKYLFYQLKSKRDYFERNSKGATVKGIKLDVLRDLVILLPPLEEQKKIAAILDAADDYRQKTKALIDKYDQLTQSLFLDMFGDPVTNPMGWEAKKLGKVHKISSGGTPSRKNPEYYSNGTIPWVKTGELKGMYALSPSEYITEAALNNSSAKLFPANTLLIAMYGATIGACSILNIEAATNQACAALIPTDEANVLYDYFFFSLYKNELIKLGVGGAQPNISAGILRSLNVMYPPLQLQNQFAERVAEIDKQKQQAEASLVKAEELFSSLLQRAFKGDLTS